MEDLRLHHALSQAIGCPGRGEVPAAETPAGGEVHDTPRAAEEVPDETEAELEQVSESDSDDWEFVHS